ncbi:ead/Ea22-like family protein [Klebsiella aerogenes]|uniref:ead/Ea22-like family protein n=1 Tax=Klebsiella aerogenes TaxID=548 RepID=UPI00190EFC06|nr:ead/Ea22-like family protein [Klebsiella aerogenes]MBK0698930.1 ead/Ea22-like family protein [Klebsiella aerogenes]
MTTDITELAQSLKAAAEKATPGRIGDRIDGSGSIKYQCFGNEGSLVLQTDHKNMEYGFIGPNSNADELFFRMCSPENIRALVEALEKAQAINAAAEKLVRCKGRYHSEQNYRELAALFGVNTPDLPPLDGESRTVTVKLPEPFKLAKSSSGLTYYYADEVNEALTAQGIKWEAE